MSMKNYNSMIYIKYKFKQAVKNLYNINYSFQKILILFKKIYFNLIFESKEI